MRFFNVLLFIFFSGQLYSQLDANVTIKADESSSATKNEYYTDLTDKLLVKYTNSVKYTKLDIVNRNTNKKVELHPAGSLDLGMEIGYKWFGLGLSYGLPSSAESDSIKGETKRFDIQFNIYSKKVVVDALYQRYKGFYVNNPENFTDWSPSILPQLPNMENYSLGASAYYILNHKKFSYRAAYVRNEIQNKSAGSLLFGPFFNFDEAYTDDQFIPRVLPLAVQDSFAIDFFSSTSYGLAIGYTYSFVIKKKVFMNFSMVPGIGVKDLKTSLNGVAKATRSGVAARITYRLAMGYEQRSFLLGLTLYGTQGSIVIDNFEFSPGAGKLKLFVAKRFDLKKKQ